MSTEKIKIESHGISPWHYHLENMSWGFCRGKAESDNIMEYLNVDPKLSTDDSRGIEDILMADFLNTLSFMSSDFLNNILGKASSVDYEKISVGENFEVRGNAGNYYIPYENEKDGVKLAQPDGWISDGNNLFLLEAKGYRNSAALNKGQLAKEYLIAKSVAEKTGHKNFYVLLIAENFEKIYKSGKEYSLKQNQQEEFAELWQANVNDLAAAFGEKLSSFMGEEWDKFKKSASENIQKHFLWVTWGEIRELADSMKGDPKAQQIVTAIDFHSDKENKKPMSIFSLLLAKLAENKEPLYHFYNGGCGNATVKDYEKIYLEAIGETDSAQAKRWADWHKLATAQEKVFKELSDLEEVRRKAAAELKDAEKKIKEFYKKNLHEINPRTTTRKAFEMLGESSQLENVSEFFEQRYALAENETEK